MQVYWADLKVWICFQRNQEHCVLVGLFAGKDENIQEPVG